MLYHQWPEEGEGAQPHGGSLGAGGDRGDRGLKWPKEGDWNTGPPLPQVKVQLQCGGDRREELEIFTARACQCDMCRLSRY